MRKQWRRVFLKEFAKTANVSASCQAAGVHRSRFYRARDRSKVFARHFEEAMEVAADRIRGEVTRRGIDGWQEPVFGKVGIIGYRRVYDGSLLAKLAAARCPEFRPASKDANFTVNATTNVTLVIPEAKRTEYQDREKHALEALLHGRN